MYGTDMSEYYLQLEDDVIASNDFVTAIKEFIASQNSQWVSLEFCRLGYIGKLYHSSDLPQLAEFLLLFYMEQPVDFLYQYFNILKAQPNVISRTPSLFQHIGTQSSLKDKTQHLKDIYFDDSVKGHQGLNPPGVVYTDIPTFQNYHPKLAYNTFPGYFWGVSPQSGNIFTLLFNEPQQLYKIIIETGSKEHQYDILHNGKVEVSQRYVTSKDTNVHPYCIDYVYLGVFTQGRFEMNKIQEHVPFNIRCIRVTVTEDQNAWLVIREIAVFPPHI